MVEDFVKTRNKTTRKHAKTRTSSAAPKPRKIRAKSRSKYLKSDHPSRTWPAPGNGQISVRDWLQMPSSAPFTLYRQWLTQRLPKKTDPVIEEIPPIQSQFRCANCGAPIPMVFLQSGIDLSQVLTRPASAATVPSSEPPVKQESASQFLASLKGKRRAARS